MFREVTSDHVLLGGFGDDVSSSDEDDDLSDTDNEEEWFAAGVFVG